MERLLARNEPTSEPRGISVDLVDLVSRIAWQGAPHLSEFPSRISINDQVANAMCRLWDASGEYSAESASTLFTTFGGGISYKIDLGVPGAVEAEGLIPPAWGRFYRPRVSIHTHQEPYPPSLRDLQHLLRKKGLYSILGYFPAMMVINESEVWAAIRSRETRAMEEEDYRSILMGLDPRVVNDANWQNIGLFRFAREYNIALYHGASRNTQLLVKIPRSR